MLKGGCLCGFVRYDADGTPFHETLCHCSMCRRAAAAPAVAWFSVPRTGFHVTAGELQRHRSSPKGTRGFCPRCGTQICFEHADHPDEIDVTTCSLDMPEQVPPRDHTRVSSRLSWVRCDDGLPQWRETRPGR